MRYVQRWILLLLLFFVFLIVPCFIQYHQNNYAAKMYQKAEAEYFFFRLCKRGCITVEEYERFCIRMRYSGYEGTIEIQEYQKQWGRNGQVYQDLVTWEEIRESLRTQGNYCFFKESEVRLYLDNEMLCGEVTSEGGT